MISTTDDNCIFEQKVLSFIVFYLKSKDYLNY